MKSNKNLSFLGLLGIVLAGVLILTNGGLWAWGEQGNPITAPASDFNYEAALSELQTAFTFQGVPVNPRAVTAMLPWLSDTLAGAIAVDIEGSTADTNQFSAEVATDDSGLVTADWEQFGEQRFAGYRTVGQLSDGTAVLRVYINTGGNAVFPFVMLVNFGLDADMGWDGELRPRLYMARRGALVLGVGYAGEITVADQSLMLIPGLQGEAVTTLNIPTVR